MALALYRKYRPRTFAEIIGQEHVTEPLSQALRSGRLHHAYLFSGPRGCGKTSSARILARSLNCEQGPTPEPCGVCGSCRSLANDGAGSIDVIEIDAASHGGVDDARELREKAFFAPANSRYKIYVIDEAHMVSPAGFNALLKLVEEPPDYVKFIFATTEPEKVLGTIRSRTHHYPFRLIPPAVLRPYLQQLTEAEGVPIEPAVFPLVVRAGGGSARDTLSVLDQLIAGAGPEGVSYARAVTLLGVTDVTLIDEMCDALAAGDGAAAYTTIDRVAEAGHDARRFASDLLERFRDLIVLQQVPDAVSKGLIDGPADQLETMGAQAARLGPATLSRCADIVHNGLVEMRGTTAPRLLLELVTARMLLPGAEDSTGALLQRLERMERRMALGGEPLPLPAGGETAATGSAPAAASALPDATESGPAPDGGAAGGRSAARAAALAVARRAAGGGGGRPGASAAPPSSSTPVSPPTSVASSSAPPSTSAAPITSPVSAVPSSSTSTAPSGTLPTSGAPSSGPPLSAASSTAVPVSAAPADAIPVSAAAPVSAGPSAAAPVSAPSGATPVAEVPGSATPVSAVPDVAAPVSPAPVAVVGGSDWNEIADGADSGGVADTMVAGPDGSLTEPELDEPPWDDDPEPADYPSSDGQSVAPGRGRSTSGNEQPASSGGQPVSGNGQLSSGNDQPVSDGGQSASRGGQPISDNGQPASGSDQPAPGGGQPASSSGGPSSVSSGVGELPEAAAPADVTPVPSAEPQPVGRAGSAGASRGRRKEPAGVLPDAPEEPGAAAVEAVAAGPGQLTAQAVRQVWPEVLAEVRKQPRGVVLRAMAADATVRELEGETVVLAVPSPRHAQGITQGAALLVNALYEVLGGQWQIRCEVAGAAGATPYGAGPGSGGGGRGTGRTTPSQRPDAGGQRQAPRAPSGVAPSGAAPSGAVQQAAQPAAAGRAPHTQQRPPEAPASGGDDEWPEPVRPGGLSTAPAVVVEDDDEDWPEVRAIPSSPPRSGEDRRGDSTSPVRLPDGSADTGQAGLGGTDAVTSGLAAPTESVTAGPAANAATARHSDSEANGVAGSAHASGTEAGAARVDADGGIYAGGVASGQGSGLGSHPAASHGGLGAADATGGFDQRGSDQRGTGQRGLDQRGTGQRGLDQNATGQRGADQQGTGQRGSEQPETGQHGSDGQGGEGSGTGRAEARGAAAPKTGGGPASGGPASGGAAGGGPASGGAAGGGAAGGGAARGGPAGVAGRNAAPQSGLAAARAAAAGARGPAAARQAAKPANDGWTDGSPTEEAPYDPEFDGPPSKAKFEGFDPGDEPLDDVIDEKTARESSEQQAMRLLQEAFGAEKIGES